MPCQVYILNHVYLSAPLLVQALAKDNVIPLLRPFSKLHNGEPRTALLFVVIIAEGVVLIGDLDFVATIVTQLYLIAYLFLNLSTGISTLSLYSKALLGFSSLPNWRPRWKFYHPALSLFTALLCVAYMLMISWITTLVSLTIMAGIYKYIEYSGAEHQWV
jgi:potassium/chloride transporter 4/5/6